MLIRVTVVGAGKTASFGMARLPGCVSAVEWSGLEWELAGRLRSAWFPQRFLQWAGERNL